MSGRDSYVGITPLHRLYHLGRWNKIFFSYSSFVKFKNKDDQGHGIPTIFLKLLGVFRGRRIQYADAQSSANNKVPILWQVLLSIITLQLQKGCSSLRLLLL